MLLEIESSDTSMFRGGKVVCRKRPLSYKQLLAPHVGSTDARFNVQSATELTDILQYIFKFPLSVSKKP